jgi:transposase
MQWSKQHIKLNKEQAKELHQLMKKFQSDRKILRRLKAIDMLDKQFKIKDIVAKLDASHDSITDWWTQFLQEWFTGLCALKYKWRRKSEFEQHKDIIIWLIKMNTYSTYSELYSAVKASVWELKWKVDALYKFCKKNEIWVIRNVI